MNFIVKVTGVKIHRVQLHNQKIGHLFKGAQFMFAESLLEEIKLYQRLLEKVNAWKMGD